MVQCPSCSVEIDHLDYTNNAIEEGYFDIRDGFQKEGEEVSLELRCPECYKILFANSDDARTFLEGGEI